MITSFLLLLMAADPDPHVREGRPIMWSWDHPQAGLTYRLMTNAGPFHFFSLTNFNVVKETATNLVMAGQSPGLAPGEWLMTLTANDGQSESDPSAPPVRLTVDPIVRPTLVVKSASPFEVTFAATNSGPWIVQGSEDFRTWLPLGMATERTPGNFYFLDIAPRTNLFYRVKEE